MESFDVLGKALPLILPETAAMSALAGGFSLNLHGLTGSDCNNPDDFPTPYGLR